MVDKEKLPWVYGGRNGVVINKGTGKVMGPVVEGKSTPGIPVWKSEDGTERTGPLGFLIIEARLVETYERRIKEEEKKGKK